MHANLGLSPWSACGVTGKPRTETEYRPSENEKGAPISSLHIIFHPLGTKLKPVRTVEAYSSVSHGWPEEAARCVKDLICKYIDLIMDN